MSRSLTGAEILALLVSKDLSAEQLDNLELGLEAVLGGHLYGDPTGPAKLTLERFRDALDEIRGTGQLPE